MGFLKMIFNTPVFQQIAPLFTEGMPAITLVVLVAAAIIISFNSHKLFKVLVAVSAAAGAAFACIEFLLPIINLEFEFFNLGGLITLACAAVGGVIGYFLYIVGVFGVGAVGGFFLADFLLGLLCTALPDVAFLHSKITYWIFCGVIAVGLGVLFAVLFRHVIIIIPSVVVSTVAGLAVGLYLAIDFAQLPVLLEQIELGTLPTLNLVLLYVIPIVFALAGIVLASFGIAHQYKSVKENA